jgi:beta-lactamase regulating signal transducer with metallopeptidase domain
MNLLETVGWLGLQSTALFFVLWGLSRLLGIRGGPALFKVLWLVFFLKLLIPMGFVHPEPLPLDTGEFSTILNKTAALPSEGSQTEPLPDTRWDWGETFLLVWGTGSLLVWGLLVLGYRRALSKPSVGPTAVGVFQPRILLPLNFASAFTPLEQELILNHENTHLKSRDPLQLLFVHFVTGLYWWLPPVWWARREFAAAMESACDARVVKGLSREEARIYGQLLVGLAARGSKSGFNGNFASFGGTYGFLRRRVTALVQPHRLKGPLAWVLAIVLASGIAALALTPPELRWAWPFPENVPVVAPANQSSLLILEPQTETSVLAVAAGTIKVVPGPETGNFLILDHGDGYASEYEGVQLTEGLTVGTRVILGQPLGRTASDCLILRIFHFGIPLASDQVFSRQISQFGLADWGLREVRWPLPRGVGHESAKFGMALHPFTGQEFFHKGTDWSAPLGTPVGAMTSGVVVKLEYGSPGYGNYVVLDHGGGRSSLYAQLERISVKKGDRVEAGERLGEVGSTGVSGPHLHWEVRFNGSYLDPMKMAYR